MILRLSGSEVIDRGDHLVVRTPANPTYFWGNFIAIADPLRAGDGQRLLEKFAAEFPAARHLAIAVDGRTGAVGSSDEVRALGTAVERSTVLTAHELEPDVASTFTVRRLQDGRDWTQLVELRRACDERPDSAQQRTYHELTVRTMRAMSQRATGAWFGAFVGNRMRSGLGVFSDGGGLARYQHVETHPDFRRRGLASALLRTAAQYALHELHARTLVIVADPDDIAIELYRSVGFSDTETQAQLIIEPEDHDGPDRSADDDS